MSQKTIFNGRFTLGAFMLTWGAMGYLFTSFVGVQKEVAQLPPDELIKAVTRLETQMSAVLSTVDRIDRALVGLSPAP